MPNGWSLFSATFVRLSDSQLPTASLILPLSDNNALSHALINEVITNRIKYLPYINETSLAEVIIGLDPYLMNRTYNTTFGDLVPVIVANAVGLNIITLTKNGSEFCTQSIEVDHSDKSVIIVKTGVHCDAVT